MYALDLIEVTLIPAILISLIAGFFSFLSPCVLPIVAPYIAFISGISIQEAEKNKGTIVLSTVFFVFGFSTVFLILGIMASSIGRSFLQYRDILNYGAAIIVMIFGIHFLGIIRIKFFDRDFRINTANKLAGSQFGAYVLGLAFAFGWSPCIGPQLGTILTLAITEGSTAKGTLLLVFYALGLGVPFIFVSLFITRLGKVLIFLKRHSDQIEKLSGVILWTTGILMLNGGLSDLSYWLLENISLLQRLG